MPVGGCRSSSSGSTSRRHASVWLCPCKGAPRLADLPARAGHLYVNVGFWGTVHVGPDALGDRATGRSGRRCTSSAATSPSGEGLHDRDTFDDLYDGANLAAVKGRHDPDDRLTSLYDKAVKRQ